MFEPIDQYYRLEYATPEAADAAEAILMHFAQTPAFFVHYGLARGNDRLVLWNESVHLENRVQYVSPGALKLLRDRGADVPPPEETQTLALPPSRQLMLGDAQDWAHTGPYVI